MRWTWRMVKLTSRLGVAGLVALALASSSHAQVKPRYDLLDARSVIRRILENDPETKIERAEKALAEHARSFADHSAEASPLRAAEWLALVDEAIALPHRSFFGGMGGAPPQPVGTLANVLITLPTPEVWPDIRALVAKRQPSLDRTALLMLCARLAGDDEEVLKLCEQYDRLAGAEQGRFDQPPRTNTIRRAALRRLGRLNEPRIIEQLLGDPDTRFDFPNLNSLLSPAQVREVILHLVQGSTDWVPLADPENRKLARQVVLDHLEDLPRAVYDLADSWTDLPYVRRLVAHYGYASLVDPQNRDSDAQQIYFRDLALNGKLEEAAKLLRDTESVPGVKPEEWGPVKDLDSFITKLQQQVNHKDLWDLYVSAAIASGHIGQARERLRTLVADPKTPHELKLSLINELFGLDAREGDLRALARDRETLRGIRRSNSNFDPTYRILDIGLASGDEELVEEGITYALASTPSLWRGGSLFRALSKRGRWGQLERLLLEQLEKRDQNPSGSAEGLCTIYYRANRPLDVLTLLREYPNWPAEDLSELAGPNRVDSYRGEDEDNQPLGFYAAWALNETGKRELALRILRNLLLRDSGLSPCYALLNRIGGASLLDFYDDVLSAHRYDPLPLLWKGDLLFRNGKLAEAEACVREAAAIDPVGTFQYREKLNDLLGQILRNEGDTEGALKCANHVAAIRLGSRAAELEQVTLLPQARQELERAVQLWPEDAVLQARLANCLVLQCLPEEAKEHYLKAFETLSACLGRGVELPPEVHALLRDPSLHQQGMEVLSRRVREDPDSASAHYARGLLNANAGKSKEAVSDLSRAAALDPGHVGAWAALASLARQGIMSPTEAQRIEFRLIELDPDSDSPWDGIADLADVSDLSSAYKALRTKLKSLPEQDRGPLFALHGGGADRRLRIFPEFDRLDKRGRLPGRYFQRSDIDQIARLFHPTNYPFD